MAFQQGSFENPVLIQQLVQNEINKSHLQWEGQRSHEMGGAALWESRTYGILYDIHVAYMWHTI